MLWTRSGRNALTVIALVGGCSSLAAEDQRRIFPEGQGHDAEAIIDAAVIPFETGDDAAATADPAFGANLDARGGVAFRVWAPHATAASVIGDFAASPVAMSPRAGGTYEVAVAAARVGSSYAFTFESPSGTISRVDPYCREVSVDRTRCRVIDPRAFAWSAPASAFTRPTRERSAVYEMHVGSFTPEGTLAAARLRLAELAELGVNVVELMPVHAFGGYAKSWGYNPHLWMAPKPDYGTAAELAAFIDEAHRVGLAVWVDFVVNHYDGWDRAPLRCFDGFCPQTQKDGIYFFGQGDYAMTPWGPRPDFAAPEVRAMLLASVDQWLLEYRGDGFRWDSVSNVRGLDGQGITPGGRELLTRANDRTHQLGGISVAEDLKGWDAITAPTSKQGFGFDAQWDGFGYDVTSFLANGDDDGRNLDVIVRALGGGYGGDPFARLLFIENHDTVGNDGARLPKRIDAANPTSIAARRRSMLGAALLLTTPGVPMLFMGQEALATTGFADPPVTLPEPTAAGLKMRVLYKDLLTLRTTLPDLASPQVHVFHRNDAAKVIAYRRGNAIVIVNFRNKRYERYDVGAPSGGTWHVRVDTDSKTYGDDFVGAQPASITALAQQKDGEPFTLPLALAPYSAIIVTP